MSGVMLGDIKCDKSSSWSVRSDLFFPMLCLDHGEVQMSLCEAVCRLWKQRRITAHGFAPILSRPM